MSAPNDFPARIGCVRYLNARPLINGWHGKVQFDHPAALCQKLARGALDVALTSSFEYLRNPVYSIVDEVAIASDGPVFSVILAHLGRIEQVREIVIDPASETSVNLLRCLLGRRKINPQLVATGEITRTRGRLLIGDQAIGFRRDAGDRYEILDLGGEWKRLADRPFVYALWLIRPDFPLQQEVAAALRSLGASNCANLESVIATQPEAEREFCNFYFRHCLRFTFGEREKEGFRLFSEQCVKQELLARVPPPPSLL